MDVSKIKSVVKDYHDKEIPPLIEREVKIEKNKSINRAIIIIGPRRAGKTYYLYQLLKDVDRNKRAYINFEDFRFEGEGYTTILDVVNYYIQLTGYNKPILFFDEIQNISGWEKAIRNLLDNGYRVYLTGSNSKLLSKEIATSLRGRSLNYYLFPFSFKEFLLSRNILPKEFTSTNEKNVILKYLNEYISLGGYPEVVF